MFFFQVCTANFDRLGKARKYFLLFPKGQIISKGQKFMVEKSGVEKFMVEKSGVERSGVEAWN